MSEPMENFRRYVDDSANLLAFDLAALLNRAYRLGVAICPVVDPDEGSSYSIEWAFKTSRHLDVEWDAGRKRWVANGAVVEGMPQHVVPMRHEPGCAGAHLSGISCAKVTELRAAAEASAALWDCPTSPSHGQRAHRFGHHPKEQWAECLNGCGMTWARIQEAVAR